MTTSPTNNNTCNNSNHQRPMDCIAKCTCNNSSSSGGGGGVGSSGIGPRYSSLRSLKLNNTPNGLISSGGGFERKSTGPMVKKLSCDATTSPGRILSRDIDMTDLNELRKKSEELIKLATGRAIASPRRVVATRNAATSPNLDMRKLGLTERKPKEIIATTNTAPNANATNSGGQKITLEKSNSLGESKPIKQLRTTRSLSPRPPVRHQHAIMVSDENDIVSVKVSPNEDFEMEQGITTRMAEMTVREAIPATAAVSAVVAAVSSSSGGAAGGGGVRKKHKPSKSEQSSPNIADFDTKFSYNQTNNKSTGCLVYVPSDPWLKMSDLEEFKVNSLHKRHNLQKMSKGTRSLSRGKIEALPATDPWIWRKPIDSANGGQRTVVNAKKSPKKEVFRQAKSFSATKYELEGGDHTKSHRPKLQRCKSPLFLEDDILPPPPPPPTSAPSSPFLKAPENQFSPPPPPLFTAIPPPPAPPHYICSNPPVTSPARNKPCVMEQSHQQQTQRSFLDVVNPNLLQARHSFSSISQRDDELQLNIRRLSEQMRKTQAGSAAMITATTTASGADFSDYLRQFRCSEAKKAAAAAQLQQQQQQLQQSQQPPPPPPLHHSSPKVTQTKLDSMLETTC